jgi:hypothetical protein
MADKQLLDFVPAGLLDTCPACGSHVLRGAPAGGPAGVYHVEAGAPQRTLHENECPGRAGRDLQTLVAHAEASVARQREAAAARDAARLTSPAEYVLAGGEPDQAPKATRAARKQAEEARDQALVQEALAPAAEAAYLRREGTDQPREA